MKSQEWKEHDSLETIHMTMLLLNGVILFLLSYFLLYTTWHLTDWQQAESFLTNSNSVPMPPWFSPLFAAVGFAFFLAISHIRKKLYLGVFTFHVISSIEIGAIIVIIATLHMSYNGILLLAAADMVKMLEEKQRIRLLAGFIFLYIISSLNALRDFLGIVPLETYFAYYSSHAASGFQSVLTMLNVLNIVLFGSYIILLLRHKSEENERISQLNSQLADMNEQLKEYAVQTERMTETRERNRLAREIHDTLGHTLTGIVAASDACAMMLDSAPNVAKQLMGEIGDTARQGITEVRRSVNALRPDALEQHSLHEALRNMAENIKKTTHTEVTLYLGNIETEYSEDEADVIFRVVQEGITNAIRHGNATHIWVTLQQEQLTEVMTVTVKDNGIGLVGEHKEDFGLLHMRERLALLDGWLEYDGSDGFTLRAYIPIRWGGIK